MYHLFPSISIQHDHLRGPHPTGRTQQPNTHSTCSRIHLIIKNIKNTLTRSRNHLLSQRTPHTKTNIVSIVSPFSDIGKQLTVIIHRNCHNVAIVTPLSTHDTTLHHLTIQILISLYQIQQYS